MKPRPTLREVFEKHGTDKAAHGYSAFYEMLPTPASLLEVGVFRGASLKAWREFWPRCCIVGLDTFERIRQEGVCELEGIWLAAGDSRKGPFLSMIGSPYSVIIDDGSHKPRDQAATFRNLWPLLAPGGVYVIEDVLPWADEERREELHPWFAARRVDFNPVTWSELIATIREVSGQVEEHHSFRAQSGKPDSYLLVIRKP